ncbi:MAG: MATE family efflux transporter [Clostridia bacterium]|nr:MATE family efflux transporter [Clostridia bacterium]
MSRRRYDIDMIDGPLWGNIARFAVPLMLTSFLQLLYNAADNVVVGRFAENGKVALAAVGSTGSLINLIVNLFIGLSVGTSIVTAQYLGKRSYKDVQETVHTSVAISVIFGFILLVIGVLFAKPLLRMMKSDPDVIDYAALYMRIYFIGMPVNMLYNFGAAVLRAIGDTKRPLYILTLSGLVNVILNLILVIGFHMDVAGVAIATIVSQAISAVMIVWCLMKTDGAVNLNLRKLKIHPKRLWELAKCGLPAGFQGMLFSISNVLIQSSVNGFGPSGIAGNSVASNLEGFIYAMMNTMYQASLTFIGQNVGAKKIERIHKITFICFVYASAVGLIGGQIMYRLGDKLISIYNKDPDVIKAGLIRMKYLCQPYLLCGLMDMMVGCLRGMGKSIVPMIVSLLGACVLRVIWVLTVFRMNPTPEILYVSYPISWAITTLAHFVCYLIVYKKLKNRFSLEAKSIA